MTHTTKDRILETALSLFAHQGYMATSMSDIASQLGITKAALYKHYTGKQEILDRIVEQMEQLDSDRAYAYDMPETVKHESVKDYLNIPVEKIRTYAVAQFNHWTNESFSSNFRKMLTLEQYRSPRFAKLYQHYLATEPLTYIASIFRELTPSDETAMQLALEFYGPMYLLYSIYDGADDKDSVIPLLNAHIDQIIQKIESLR